MNALYKDSVYYPVMEWGWSGGRTHACSPLTGRPSGFMRDENLSSPKPAFLLT